MKCEYCGRKLKDGELTCECGHAAGSSPKDERPQGAETKQESILTPDGRDLSSLKKPAKLSKGANAAIILAMALFFAVGAFIIYKLIIGADLRDEDTWKKIDKDTFSITLPSAMKESDDKKELDADYEKLGFFKAGKASVYISKADFNEDEKKMLKLRGVEGVRNWTLENAQRQKLNARKEDDLIIVELAVRQDDLVKGTDELWQISGTLITEDCIYQIDAFCAYSEMKNYAECMLKWIKSFKVK